MFFNKRTGLRILTYYLEHKRDDVWKGAIAGAIGGLVGSGLMQAGQMAFSARKQNQQESSPQAVREGTTPEDPTVKVATVIAEKVMKTELSPNGRKAGGALVHYVFGSSLGAAYGVMMELVPFARSGAGVPFGAAVWAAADLASVPALGLSKAPNQITISKHAQMLGMHVAYGLATEAVRRYVRDALD
jgi:putative membrane protein